MVGDSRYEVEERGGRMAATLSSVAITVTDTSNATSGDDIIDGKLRPSVYGKSFEDPFHRASRNRTRSDQLINVSSYTLRYSYSLWCRTLCFSKYSYTFDFSVNYSN